MNNPTKGFLVALAILAILGAGAGFSHSTAAVDHCPDHNGHPGKIDGNNNALVLDAGTVLCVKAGPEAGGKQTADGVTPLSGYVDWTVGPGNTPDVSYYVVYTLEPTPEPTPEVTPPPSVTPSATPEPTVSPTPTASPTPSVTPEPTPVSTPNPPPVVEDDPTPTPAPEPTPTVKLIPPPPVATPVVPVAPVATPTPPAPTATPDAPVPAITGQYPDEGEVEGSRKFAFGLGGLSLALLGLGRFLAHRRGL